MEDVYSPEKESLINIWTQKRKKGEIFKSGFNRLRSLFQEFTETVTQRNITIVTIAGTNGKGETLLRTGSYLTQIGKSWAGWTSPHVLELRERFCYNNRLISYQELILAIESCQDLIPALSYYEFHFYVFCHIMLKKEKLDYLLLEVGMGGRLDAVNLFDADVAAIVSISYDHCEYLGETLEEILEEKLGVARPGKTLVTSLENLNLREKCSDYTTKKGILWRDLFEEGTLKLQDKYPRRNDILAQTLYQTLLGKQPTAPLKDISLKGRREHMTYKAGRFLFIGAHNQDGLKKMVQSLKGSVPRKILVSFSRRRTMDILVGLEALSYLNPPCGIVLAPFSHPRGFRNKEWKALCREVVGRDELRKKIEIVESWRTIVGQEFKQGEGLLVCGSYYFIGEIQKFILECHGRDSFHSALL